MGHDCRRPPRFTVLGAVAKRTFSPQLYQDIMDVNICKFRYMYTLQDDYYSKVS